MPRFSSPDASMRWVIPNASALRCCGERRPTPHCECSRQSVLYILEQLLPERHITVRTVETVLGGGTCCRFAVTVE